MLWIDVEKGASVIILVDHNLDIAMKLMQLRYIINIKYVLGNRISNKYESNL